MTAIKKQLTGILKSYYIVLHKFGTVDIYNDSGPNKWALPDSFSKETVFGIRVSDKEKEAISTIHSLISAHGLDHRHNNDEWLPPYWWPHWGLKENGETRIDFRYKLDSKPYSIDLADVSTNVAREWALTQVLKQYEAWELSHGTKQTKETKENKLTPFFSTINNKLELKLNITKEYTKKKLELDFLSEIDKIKNPILEELIIYIDKFNVEHIFGQRALLTIDFGSVSEQSKQIIMNMVHGLLLDYDEIQEMGPIEKELKPKGIETTEPTQIVDALNHISFSIESLTELIRNRT